MSGNRNESLAAAPGRTLPGLLKASASTYGNRPWMRRKQSGLWRVYSWREGHDKVRHFSLGLTSLGFGPGHTLCIIGDSSPQWFWAQLAAQAAGGNVLGVSRGWPAAQTAAAARQFGVQFVAVQDREQVENLLGVKGEVPSLLKVIYWDARGIEADREALLTSFDRVADTGRDLDASQSGAFDERTARIRPSEGAITRCDSVDGSAVSSRTLTHEGLLAAVEGLRLTDPFDTSDSWFSYTPAEGTVEQTMALAGSLTSGMSIDFPENQQTAQQDLREVGSTVACYPSAVWEALAANITDRIEKTTFVKRMVARMAGRAGSTRADAALNGRKPGGMSKVPRALADFGYYHPLKARIGLANARYVFSYGMPLTPETLRALLGMGLNVRQLDVSGETVMIRQTRGGNEASPEG